MKAGDTAYLVESNRFVYEVEILRCNGELYIVCFKDNGVGLYFKAYHLLLTSWKTVKSISQAPEHEKEKIADHSKEIEALKKQLEDNQEKVREYLLEEMVDEYRK